MSKDFKPGDVLVLDYDHPQNSPNSDNGTIRLLRRAQPPFKVVCSKDAMLCITVESADGKRIQAFPERFKLDPSANQPGSFIVCLVQPSGRLSMAPNPKVHASREAAEKEALRLAELRPGSLFRVYSFDYLATAYAPKPEKPVAKIIDAVAR